MAFTPIPWGAPSAAPSERGLGNGIQFAGGYFGFIGGGGGILVIHDHLGWTALGVLALATAVPMPFLLRYSEAHPDIGATGGIRRRHTVSLRALANFFHQPGVAHWLLIVLPLNYMGIATAYKLITPMLVDLGWPLDWIGPWWPSAAVSLPWPAHCPPARCSVRSRGERPCCPAE